MKDISVIICTHNPRPEFLRRVLDALKGQTLALDGWELLLVDNASKEPLADKWDLSWHPQGRHVLEKELGLTAARLRGIAENRGELIVFVDDDNILAPDYLANAVAIGKKYPFISLWGGRIDPEFEITPPEWTRRFWSYLALHPIEHSYWSNIVTDYALPPCGAGLCVRREIAQAYAEKVLKDATRKLLGRRGKSLASCEDTDLALMACDMGGGYGMFTELRLLHIIPKGRLEEEYLLRLEEGIACSSLFLKLTRERPAARVPERKSLRRHLGWVRRRLTMKRLERLILEARLRGWNAAHEMFATLR